MNESCKSNEHNFQACPLQYGGISLYCTKCGEIRTLELPKKN